jgi:cation transport ATPase
MTAVHIRTDGMYCNACPHRIESRIEHLSGVKAARSYRALRLTSVLYDPDLIDADTVRTEITSAGFGATSSPQGRTPLWRSRRLAAPHVRPGSTYVRSELK